MSSYEATVTVNLTREGKLSKAAEGDLGGTAVCVLLALRARNVDRPVI